MPSFADSLRTEVLRLARKEIRKEIAPFKAQCQKMRKELSATKAASIFLKRELDRLKKAKPSAKPEPETKPQAGRKKRYSPQMLVAFAKKHDLGGSQIAALLGGSLNSAYRWLDGQVPRQKYIDAFHKVRDLPKAKIAELLESA